MLNWIRDIPFFCERGYTFLLDLRLLVFLSFDFPLVFGDEPSEVLQFEFQMTNGDNKINGKKKLNERKMIN